VLGQADVRVRGAPVLALQHIATTILVEFQSARQDFIDPCRMQIGKARIVRFLCFVPFVIGLAQPLALGCIEFFQPLRESFLQDGNGEEWAGNLDEARAIRGACSCDTSGRLRHNEDHGYGEGAVVELGVASFDSVRFHPALIGNAGESRFQCRDVAAELRALVLGE